MIEKKFQRKPETWWLEQKVRTNKELRNGWTVVPAGTVCRVTRKWKGLTLRTDPCEHCGVAVLISKVPYRDLELIEV